MRKSELQLLTEKELNARRLGTQDSLGKAMECEQRNVVDGCKRQLKNIDAEFKRRGILPEEPPEEDDPF